MQRALSANLGIVFQTISIPIDVRSPSFAGVIRAVIDTAALTTSSIGMTRHAAVVNSRSLRGPLVKK